MERQRKTKRWWISFIIWLVLAGVLSSFAPGAKEFVVANKNAGLPADSASIIAGQKLEKYFPSDGGLPLFAVFYKEAGLTEDDTVKASKQVEDITADDSVGDVTVLALSKLPDEVRKTFLSEDQTTYFVPITLNDELEGKALHEVVKKMKDHVKLDQSIEVSWTGPAGIASDAVELFSQADVVLLLSTVGLILLLLLVIYRSPLLTFIPLLGAGIVYVIVDKIIGLSLQAELFGVDSQALSIMTILLFAVVTDYSLLIFSRYREELKTHASASEAMRETMRHVKEPIFFSGSTIVLGVATLFFALYEPYRNFAPAFAIAAGVMLIAGLTLLPSLFALIGRKAFWPVIPKYGEQVMEKKSIWGKVADKVTARPVAFFVPIMLILAICAWNVTSIKESYDLIDSFPEDLSSRVGYERLGESFSEGSLAPGTILVVSKEGFEGEALLDAMKELEKAEGVKQIAAQGHPLSEDGKAAKFTITFAQNPYALESLDAIEQLRKQGSAKLEQVGLKGTQFYIAGESAINTDLRELNQRDNVVVMSVMTILIALMLGFQTRSVVAPIYMVGTILLSYAATLGLSLWLFDWFLDLDAISYRIPLYTFVFLLALGVDYSIMLIARVREEMKHLPFAEAVRKGVDRTGGVISSAGLILAATFLVLATMPIYELKLFGFMMALGILIDTFVVRPLVIPALLIMLGKWSFWPKKM